MDIRFISSNSNKIEEVKSFDRPVGINIISVPKKIEELQTDDLDALVKDKALKAFRMLGRPLFVEHTGLYVDVINKMPGGLTQLFWDALEAERFSKLFGGENGESKAKAVTVIGYIDGKKFHSFRAELEGSITSSPRGNKEFQWDCIFVPAGENETLAEMGARKDEFSMRKIAWEEFMKYLQ